MLVGDLQIVVDCGLEFRGAPAELPVGEETEPALDQVNPRCTGGSEVDMKVGPFAQPPLDEGGLVSSLVIHDEMDVQSHGDSGIDGVEELPKLGGSVAAMALADHCSRVRVEGGEQRCGPVPHIVMGPALPLARPHRQQGTSTVQCLYLGLSSTHRPGPDQEGPDTGQRCPGPSP